LAEQVLSLQFGSQPWLVVETLGELSSRLYDLGERETERAMLGRARKIARDAQLPTQLATTDCTRAYSFAYDDQLDSARAALAEARVALEVPGARTDVVTALCLDAEGQVLVAEGHPDSAIARFKRAVDIAGGVSPALTRQQITIDLSSALRGVGRTREASVYQRQVIIELDSTGFRATDVLPNVIGYLTSALFELGELAAVDSVVAAALRAQSRVLRQHSSGNLSFLFGLAELRLGALDSADVWIARAMRDTTEGAGGLSAYLPPAITQLRLEQGRIADAWKSLRDLPSGTLTRRVNRVWLTARIRHAEGDTKGAAAMLEDSLRGLRGDAVKPPPALAVPFATAAEWRLAARDFRGADSLAQLGRLAGAVDSIALERSGYVGRAELIRARAQLALGDTTAARRIAERAVTALASGYGDANPRTREARSFRASLGP
jgi:hypothetical protein